MNVAPVHVALAVATVAFAVAGVLAVLLQAFWDCPLACPAVLMALFGLLAAEEGASR